MPRRRRRSPRCAPASSINGAVRRTHYSLSGTVYTWKLGGSYEPFAGLRFRATRSRDIRAPNIAELFENGGSSNTNVFDPVLGRSVQIREISAGNPNLKPEKADTLTAGATFQPSFLQRLSASIDYYDIKIRDAIATLGRADARAGLLRRQCALLPVDHLQPGRKHCLHHQHAAEPRAGCDTRGRFRAQSCAAARPRRPADHEAARYAGSQADRHDAGGRPGPPRSGKQFQPHWRRSQMDRRRLRRLRPRPGACRNAGAFRRARRVRHDPA